MEWTPINEEVQQADVLVSPAYVVQRLFQNDKYLLDAIKSVGERFDRNLDEEMDLREMYRMCSEATLLQCNQALSQAYGYIDVLQEQTKAKTLLLARAEQDMMGWMEKVREDFEKLGRYLIKDELEVGTPASPGMDWEPTTQPLQIDYTQFLREQVHANQLHAATVLREDSVHPPATPVAPRAVHPADFAPEAPPTIRRKKSQRATPPAIDPNQLEAAIVRQVQESLEEKLLNQFTGLSAVITAEMDKLRGMFNSASAPPPPPPPADPVRENSPARGPSRQGAGGGNGGSGNGRKRGAPGGGDSGSGSSTSSDGEDSEPDPALDKRGWKRWWKNKMALRKACRGKRAVSPSAEPDVDSRRKHHGRMEKVEPFSGEKVSYDVEDFLWNLESKFEIEAEAWKDNNRAKVRFASSCLTGKALTWFRSYRYQVNPSEAKRAGLDTEANPKYWDWSFFASQLRRSFGSKDQKEKALKQWDELKHTGSIDEFCDEIERLMWMVNFNQPAIEHKIKSSLKYELRKDWAKVQNKPESLRDQLSMLREMGRPIEEFKEVAKKSDKPSASSSSGKRKREDDEPTTSAKKKSRSDKSFGRFSSKEEAIKGISKDIINERMRARVCWRCGRSNHRAMDCEAAAPVTVRVAASKKGKEKKETGGQVSAVVGSEESTQLVVAGSSTDQIVEMSSDDEMVDD